MGINHLTDLTHEEFMIRNQLKVPENLPQSEITYKMEANVIAAEVDWREKVNFIIISFIRLLIKG